jgi:hypothetical protein
MFWDKFVRRVYRSLGKYIRERQRDRAIVEIDPAIVVRAFIGMVMHHSLNNNLWDPKRSLLKISNEVAAREFAGILLNGLAVKPERKPQPPARKLRSARTKTPANGGANGARRTTVTENFGRKKPRK